MKKGDSGGGGGLGGDQVEGRRAVTELLKAGRRRVRTVFMNNTTVDDDIAELAGGALKLVSPDRIENLARSDVHQGVIAQAAPLKSADLDELLDAPDAFLVALDGVTDPRNLGAILRSAETAGATGVLLPRHRSAHITPVAAKAAAGAIEYLPIALVSGIPAALDRAQRKGVWCVGLDERGERDLAELDLADQRIVIVLGAEGKGLARLTRDRCDMLVRIPMKGHVASLNVAAAATLACHEVARRRT
jgi:23S rRNA (guanosine2251-2'-O)-methyltransferase